MRTHFVPAFVLFLVLTLITGVLYPLLVTGVAAIAFPDRANGSILVVDGKARGSALIGQQFSAPGHFWGRLSATAPMPTNALASTGSNLGPLNPALSDAAGSRIEALRALGDAVGPVPVDLVTASASGLDPHISPAAAEYQVARVARARGLSPEVVRELVKRFTEERTVGLLGEPRVNVLRLNLALEAMPGAPAR